MSAEENHALALFFNKRCHVYLIMFSSFNNCYLMVSNLSIEIRHKKSGLAGHAVMQFMQIGYDWYGLGFFNQGQTIRTLKSQKYESCYYLK